jgi:adenylosuccinate synthase
MLEGQLGVMRDLDWGAYPYVTSSNPLASYGPVGAGLPPQSITQVIGVVKAYVTAVGAGPLPTELADCTGDTIRQVGREYGATTGRPRRCGWLDAPALRYAHWLNGFTSLVVTKLDVLDSLAEIKICTAYRLPSGHVTDQMPDPSTLGQRRAGVRGVAGVAVHYQRGALLGRPAAGRAGVCAAHPGTDWRPGAMGLGRS